jgi:hypothetical protein
MELAATAHKKKCQMNKSSFDVGPRTTGDAHVIYAPQVVLSPTPTRTILERRHSLKGFLCLSELVGIVLPLRNLKLYVMTVEA